MLIGYGYCISFCYVAPGIPNRDDMIVDCDSNEGNDYLQSDMVALAIHYPLLNPEDRKRCKFADYEFKNMHKVTRQSNSRKTKTPKSL